MDYSVVQKASRHVERLASDVARVGRGQEDNQVRDVVGLLDTLEGNSRNGASFHGSNFTSLDTGDFANQSKR